MQLKDLETQPGGVDLMPGVRQGERRAHTAIARERPQRGLLHHLILGPGGAATMAGACEILLFHPFDTIAKRLMSYRHHVVEPGSIRHTMHNVNHVVFGGLEDKARADPAFLITPWRRMKFLYPGSTYAVLYKIFQRVIKFAGQPFMRDFLYNHYSFSFFKGDPTTNKGYVRDGKGLMMLEATAGCFVGIFEIVLLPFDRMKVLNQTNISTLQGRGIFSVIRREGLKKLYVGTSTTVVRNATGSFLLFGCTAFAKEHVFKLSDYREATVMQNIASSTFGGCVGVLFTSPIDVIKTRQQSQRLNDSLSGLQILRKTLHEEGISALYKGIAPKIITSAPRLVFSYTMTEYLTKLLRRNSFFKNNH
ncbi:unnamed protein product [Phytomonas sp. Hart1]|nr:unnamed protein product [Phytomonas sp. Hart1]|eukprot:CCW70484.1 unnamed protein product [Phytomonas sp. isolate Hart1]